MPLQHCVFIVIQIKLVIVNVVFCCCCYCCCSCCCSWVGDDQQLTRDRRYRCFISFSLWKSVIRQIFCPRNTLQTECFPYQSIIRQGIIRSQGWKHNRSMEENKKKCNISIMNAYQFFFRTFLQQYYSLTVVFLLLKSLHDWQSW